MASAGPADIVSKYSMDYIWTAPGRKGKGICLSGEERAPGPCTKESCPGGFFGTDTTGGKPEVCQGVNVGVSGSFRLLSTLQESETQADSSSSPLSSVPKRRLPACLGERVA